MIGCPIRRSPGAAALATILATSLFASLFAGLFADPTLAQPRGANDPEVRGERTIQVETPGWVAVRLDGEALRFAEDDLGLVDPTGQPTVFRLRRDEGETRSGEILAIDEGDSGWWVEIDLGPNPPSHSRLTFDVEQLAAAPGVILQARLDDDWTELARADLFRLGGEARFTRSTLDYPTSTARSLRLFWPRLADLPKLRRVTATGGGASETTTELTLDCRPLAGNDPDDSTGDDRSIDCRAVIPAPQSLATRLDVEIDGAGGTASFGWRLFTVRDGRLQVDAASTAARPAQTASGASLRLPLDGAADAIRLVLTGNEEPAPKPVGARLASASFDLVFRAERAGPYRLAWGFPAGAEVPPGPRPPADASLQRLDAGDERLFPWPTPSERLAGPAAPLPPGAVTLRRLPEAVADGSRPAAGDVVRVLLPADLSTRDLRLAVGGRLLPFVLDAAQPQLVARARLEPESEAKGPWSSHAPLDGVDHLDRALGGAHTLWLFADGPFERGVGFLAPAQPGAEARALGRQDRWSCRSSPPLPCALQLESGALSRRATLRDTLLVFDDGDDRPLPGVALEAWGERRALRFVWPSSGEPPALVRLPGSGLARFDLDVMAPSLTARPALTLALDSLEPSSSPAPRWIGLVGLALGALALLWLLRRLLREADGADEADSR